MDFTGNLGIVSKYDPDPVFRDVHLTLPFISSNDAVLQFGSITGSDGQIISPFVIEVQTYVVSKRCIVYDDSYDAEVNIFGYKNSDRYKTPYDGLYSSEFVDIYVKQTDKWIQVTDFTIDSPSSDVTIKKFDVSGYNTNIIRVVNNDNVFPAVVGVKLGIGNRVEWNTYVIQAKIDEPYPVTLTLPYGIEASIGRSKPVFIYNPGDGTL